MDHGNVIKQAWHNVLHYRALWIFGVILALTTVSWVALLVFSGNDNAGEPRVGLTITVEPGETSFEALERTVEEELDEAKAAIKEANRDLDRFFARELDVEIESDILMVVAVLAGLVAVIYGLAKIARYVAEASLIRMVDETADTGERQSVRKGLRMGWSRSAWRLFLIDLVINTPVALAFLILFALALTPLLLWDKDRLAAGVLGTVVAAGLVFLVIGLAVLVAAALSLLKPVFRRVCVLEDQGVTGSIRQGWNVVRHHLGDLSLTWLIVFGVNLAWPFIVAPIVLALVGAGVLVGSASALLAGGLVALAFGGAAPWIAAFTSGIIIFLLALAAPLAFLGGLREVFLSSVWTLTYRHVRTSKNVESLKSTRVDASGLEAVPIV